MFRAGYGIRLYRFLIIAFLSTLSHLYATCNQGKTITTFVAYASLDLHRQLDSAIASIYGMLILVYVLNISQHVVVVNIV